MSDPSKSEEIVGMILADHTIVVNLLLMLVSCGVLSKEEAVKVLLVSLDNLDMLQMNAPDDQSYRVARQTVQKVLDRFDTVSPSVPND